MADDFGSFKGSDSQETFFKGLETLKQGMSDVAVAGALRDAQKSVDEAKASSADDFEFYKQARGIANQTALKLGASGADAAKISAITNSFQGEPSAYEANKALQTTSQEFDLTKYTSEQKLKREENQLNRDLKLELAKENKLSKEAAQKVPAGTVEKVTSLDTYLNQAEKIKKFMSDPKVQKELGLKNVGGLNELYMRMSGGNQNKEAVKAFNTLHVMINDFAHASTGAARGFPELKWLAESLPKLTDSPETFKAVLDNGIQEVSSHKQQFLDNLVNAGHAKAANLRSAPTPSAPAAPVSGGNKYFTKSGS